MTADAWKAIDSRRNLKRKLIDAKSERLHERYQQQYSEADRKVKRLTRDDKRAHIAAKRDQQGTVYKITSSSVENTKLMPSPSSKTSKDPF